MWVGNAQHFDLELLEMSGHHWRKHPVESCSRPRCDLPTTAEATRWPNSPQREMKTASNKTIPFNARKTSSHHWSTRERAHTKSIPIIVIACPPPAAEYNFLLSQIVSRRFDAFNLVQQSHMMRGKFRVFHGHNNLENLQLNRNGKFDFDYIFILSKKSFKRHFLRMRKKEKKTNIPHKTINKKKKLEKFAVRKRAAGNVELSVRKRKEHNLLLFNANWKCCSRPICV